MHNSLDTCGTSNVILPIRLIRVIRLASSRILRSPKYIWLDCTNMFTCISKSSRVCVVDICYPFITTLCCRCVLSLALWIYFVDVRFSVSVNLFCGLVFFCHGKFFFFFLTLVFLSLGVCVVDVCFPVIKSLSLWLEYPCHSEFELLPCVSLSTWGCVLGLQFPVIVSFWLLICVYFS